MADQVDEFLEHYGVPGMKWGKRKATSTVAESLGLSKGATPRDKNGDIKKPSYAREALIGTFYNSKKRYTDPRALATRTRAGKLAGTAALLSVGSTALDIVAGSSKNPSVQLGAAVAAKYLGGAGSIVGTGALITGLGAVRQERVARAGNQG